MGRRRPFDKNRKRKQGTLVLSKSHDGCAKIKRGGGREGVVLVKTRGDSVSPGPPACTKGG